MCSGLPLFRSRFSFRCITSDWRSGTIGGPRPDLCDPVLFLLGCEEQAFSGVFPVLPGLEPSPGSTAVGGLCTTATSPTALYRVPDGDPGGAW